MMLTRLRSVLRRVASPWEWLIVAALFCAALAQAGAQEPGLYLELGIGADASLERSHNPRSAIRLRLETQSSRWWIPDVYEIDHHSGVRDGWPFNDRPDETTDQFSVLWRIRLR